MHTVVVGGGVIGTCCAFELAHRGGRVTLIERGEIGGAASFGNAGSIAPGHAPINRPGVVRRALGWMLRPTSPIYIAPRPDPAMARWLWEFNRHCSEEHLAHAMNLLGPLGHRSKALFDHIIAKEQIACDYRGGGYYEVFASNDAFAAAELECLRLLALGYRPQVLDPRRLGEREPALASGLKGAVWHPEAATCNPHRFVVELGERVRRHGAEIRTGVEVVDLVIRQRRVRGVRLATGETVAAEAVLLATGAYSRSLIRGLGTRLPLQPAKGYHRDAAPANGGEPPLKVACVLAESLIFCTPMDDFVRFAGTLEFSGLNHEIRRPRLEQLTRGARGYLPRLGELTTRSEWCGLRPCLPDGLPAVGWVPGVEGLFVATGHAMMGLTLGPVTGELAAEAILDGRTSIDIAALDPGRF